MTTKILPTRLPSRAFIPNRRGKMIRAVLFLACAALLLTAESGCTRAAKKARRLAQANEYFAAGDYEKAEIEYRNALQLAPMDPDAISHLAIIFFDQGRNGMYAAYLAKAYELQPANLDVRDRLAMVDNQAGKFSEARDQALFVLAQRPDDEDAPLTLATSARTPKEVDEVRQRLLKLPSNSGAAVLVALASLEMRQNKLTEAEALLVRAQKLQPKSSVVAAGLAAIYAAKGDAAAAEKAYANAAALAPARSGVRLRYAEFSMRSGKPEQAKRILNEATQKNPDFLPAWMLLAQIAETEKKPDECLAAVGKILALDAVHHDAWLLSARAHLSKGEVDKAQSELERLEKSFPKSPELQYELGVVHVAKGEPEKAIAALNQALALAPEAAGANELLASLYVRTGSPAIAVKMLVPLVQKHPQLAPMRLLLAQAYRVQGNLEGALGVYAQMEKDFRANAQIGYYEGLIYLQQKKTQEARKAFNQSLAIDAGNLAVTEQLVDIDLAEKKFAAAQQRVDALIAKNPKAAELYLLRARIFAANADPKQAETALQRVIELNPESAVGYFLLAELYLRSNDKDKALANLQQSVAKNPKNLQALALIAAIQEQQQNYPGARETYEKILALNPKSPLVLNNLAFLLSERFNDLDKAVALAQEARKQVPASPEVADTLGWILYKKHDYARALSLLAESAEKMPANVAVQFHLGMAAYMVGNEKQAQAALEHAVGSNPGFEGSAEAKRALALLAIDPRKGAPGAQASLEKAVAERADPVALIRLGASYEQSGATDKAAASYEAALKISPESVNAALGMIRVQMSRHETAKALELAKATRKLAPNDAEVGHVLGHLAFAAGDRTWALGLLQESARKLPDDPEVLYDLAQAAYSLGQVPTAEEALQGTLAAHPAAATATQARDLMEMIDLAKDPAKALAAAMKIDQRLKTDPSDVPALMVLGTIQEKRADFAAARKTYEKVLARYDNFAPAQRNLTIIYSGGVGTEPNAIELATRARQALPDDAELAKAFGILLFRQGNFSRAAAVLQESALKLTMDAEIMFYLGSAQASLKDSQASRRSLQRALDLGLNADLAAKAKKMIPPNGKQ